MSRNRRVSYENDDHSRYAGTGYRGPEENFGMGEIDPRREGTLEKIRSQQLNQPIGNSSHPNDARINQEAIDALMKHPEVDVSDIEVKVEGGVVYLRGSVSSREAKRLAEESLNGINGIEDVMNEVRVVHSDLRLS